MRVCMASRWGEFLLVRVYRLCLEPAVIYFHVSANALDTLVYKAVVHALGQDGTGCKQLGARAQVKGDAQAAAVAVAQAQ